MSRIDRIFLYRRWKNIVGEKMRAPLTNGFQRVSQLVGIIGMLATLWFARLSYNLSIKYGENRDQINRLDTLARVSRVQLDTLISMLREQRKQSDKLDEELGINRKELVRNDKNELAERRSNLNKLANTVSQLKQEGDWKYGDEYAKKVDPGMMGNIVGRVKYFLGNELHNPILLEDDLIYVKWTKTFAQLSNDETLLNTEGEDEKRRKIFIKDVRQISELYNIVYREIIRKENVGLYHVPDGV